MDKELLKKMAFARIIYSVVSLPKRLYSVNFSIGLMDNSKCVGWVETPPKILAIIQTLLQPNIDDTQEIVGCRWVGVGYRLLG